MNRSEKRAAQTIVTTADRAQHVFLHTKSTVTYPNQLRVRVVVMINVKFPRRNIVVWIYRLRRSPIHTTRLLHYAKKQCLHIESKIL